MLDMAREAVVTDRREATDLNSNRMQSSRLALAHLIQIVGEAANRVSQDLIVMRIPKFLGSYHWHSSSDSFMATGCRRT